MSPAFYTTCIFTGLKLSVQHVHYGNHISSFLHNVYSTRR